jgi:hypothetical protein
VREERQGAYAVSSGVEDSPGSHHRCKPASMEPESEQNKPDEPQAQPDRLPHDISGEEIHRFFLGVWRNGGCEVCGQRNSWVTLADDDRYSVLSMSGPKQPFNPFPHRVFFALNVVCTNCGNIKLLSLASLQKWLRENPAP